MSKFLLFLLFFQFGISLSAQTPTPVGQLMSVKLNCGDKGCGSSGIFYRFNFNNKVNRSNMCNAFLVERNIVATNAHCLNGHSEELRNCSKYFAFKFKDSENRDILRKCKRVISRTQDHAKYVDLAFIEIEPIKKIRPSAISRNGIEEGEPLIIRTFISNDDNGYTLKSRTCYAKYYTFGHYVPSAFYPLLFLGGGSNGCDFEKGNSGSIILKNNSEVAAGIMYGGIDLDLYQTLPYDRYQFTDNAIEAVLAITNKSYVIGSNFSCIDLPYPLPGKKSDNCSPKESSFKLKALKPSFDEAFYKVADKIPDFLSFEAAYFTNFDQFEVTEGKKHYWFEYGIKFSHFCHYLNKENQENWQTNSKDVDRTFLVIKKFGKKISAENFLDKELLIDIDYIGWKPFFYEYSQVSYEINWKKTPIQVYQVERTSLETIRTYIPSCNGR